MRIGSYQLDSNIVLAPMAGITDLPFRRLCLRYGAGLAVSEMISSNPDTWDTDKSRQRLEIDPLGETGIRAVQIAGSDPDEMAAAAAYNAAQGAQIIDINMGCPAKKVNKKMAGSALLQYPQLVHDILSAVVNAVDIPVTLKIRTGWDAEHRNGIQIATIAEQLGIQALAVHGRTRACLFKGEAEYDTIRAIKQAVSIPVIANGDIDTVEKARHVLHYTGADAIMIGRGAQGKPWIFRDIAHYLRTGEQLAPPSATDIAALVQAHVAELHRFYGEVRGVRIARKHVGWYLQNFQDASAFRQQFNGLETASEQSAALAALFPTHLI